MVLAWVLAQLHFLTSSTLLSSLFARAARLKIWTIFVVPLPDFLVRCLRSALGAWFDRGYGSHVS